MLNSLRLAFRSLLRSRGFFLVTVLTLAVAIGATTAICSVVDAVLLRPLPYPDAEELITLRLPVQQEGAVESLPFSDRGFWHFHDGSRSYEHFGGFNSQPYPLVGEGDPVQLWVGIMTREAFDAIGVSPIRGRLPTAEEDLPNGPEVGLISEALWQGRFGGDPEILGRRVDLNGQLTEIIGVMPDSYDFPQSNTDFWIPYQLNRENQNFGGHHIRAIARLADGTTSEAAATEGASLVARFDEAGYGQEWLDNVFSGEVDIAGLHETIVGDSRRPLVLILGTVFFVLLIACGNVANLLLVRAESRTRETAVRTALGANRWQLIRDVLAESLVIAAVGGIVGIVLALMGTRVLVALGPSAIPRLDEIGMSPQILLFSAGLVIGCAVIMGIFPAVRVGMERSVEALRDGGRSATIGRDRHRARSFLVVAQVALALVLLVGSVLMVRSFQALRSVPTGFQQEGVATFSIRLSPTRIETPENAARFQTELANRLEEIPGVISAGGINVMPLTGGGPVLTTQIDEFPLAPGDFPPAYPIRRVSRGYFEAMGIPLVEGRTFDERDHDQRLGTVIVSASFKDEYWPNSSALGKRLQATAAPAEIVGVVGDVRDEGLDQPVQPILYFPLLDSIAGGTLGLTYAVRTRGDPATLVPQIRRAVAELDPDLPIVDISTMGGIVAESMSRTTFTMTLLVLAAVVALFLGSVGIYGVISYIVAQRTAEMGIRQALGASPGDVRTLVLRQGIALTAIGILVGLFATLWIGRSLATLLYVIEPFDLVSFAGGAAIFLAVAALASLIPALRASRVAPAIALRE